MNNDEAKFILGAYRPDGRDAADLTFREALAHAEADPTARTWFERARAVDAALSAKLAALAPPAGLREAILAGARASQPRARPWNEHPALMAAAIVMLLGILTWSVRLTTAPEVLDAADDFTQLAVRDLAEFHGRHVGHPPGLAALQAQLASAAPPLAKPALIDVDQLRRQRCRRVVVAGHEMFEVCFQRDGRWFHLYAAQRGDFAAEALGSTARLTTHGKLVAASWADQENIYTLVTSGPPESLRPLI